MFLNTHRTLQWTIICQRFFSPFFDTCPLKHIPFPRLMFTLQGRCLARNYPPFWHFIFYNFNFLQQLCYLMEIICKLYSLILKTDTHFKIICNIVFWHSNIIMLSKYCWNQHSNFEGFDSKSEQNVMTLKQLSMIFFLFHT